MRDIVTHDYFGVKPERVWKTVREDLAFLKEKMLKIMDEVKPVNG